MMQTLKSASDVNCFINRKARKFSYLQVIFSACCYAEYFSQKSNLSLHLGAVINSFLAERSQIYLTLMAGSIRSNAPTRNSLSAAHRKLKHALSSCRVDDFFLGTLNIGKYVIRHFQ